MSVPVRKWTFALNDAIDNGLLSNEGVVQMCLTYMSEADVEDMLRLNDLCEYVIATDRNMWEDA